MKKNLLFFLVIILIPFWTKAQDSGCTDSLAKNYNQSSKTNDGSCTYENSDVKPETSFELPSSLVESSGLIFWNNQIWSQNDSDDINLYSLNPKDGKIIDTYPLTGHKNKDWEEISQDENYIYVGDFGNNSKGNRDGLKILKIEKNSLLNKTPDISVINFSYSNQTDFTKKEHNNTDFDCEAFIVSKDSIYLFTKQWISKKTSVYKLPKTPGTFKAELKETFDINGLVTGATYLEEKQLVALCGYSPTLQPFIYLLYDFKDKDFFSGNKRKISLSLPYHQIEGITTNDGLHFYLSNEYFSKPIIGTTPQKLHLVDLSNWLWPYIDSLVSNQSGYEIPNFSFYPNPVKNSLTIVSENFPTQYYLLNSMGQKVMTGVVTKENPTVTIKSLRKGTYYLKINSENSQKLKVTKK